MKNVFLSMFICALSLAENGPYQLQANLLAAFQPEGAKAVSLQVAWVPQVNLDETYAVRAELGVTLLKSVEKDIFFATNYELFGQMKIAEHLTGELGGGWATWIGNGGTQPIVSTYLLSNLIEGFGSQYIGFSHFFLRDRPANELKLGVRVAF